MMTMELAATLGKKVVIERVRAERAAKKRVLKTALGCVLMMLEQAKQNGILQYVNVDYLCTDVAHHFVDKKLHAQQVIEDYFALAKRLRVHVRKRMDI